MKNNLNNILSRITGKTLEIIEYDIERDNFMPIGGAVRYGLMGRAAAKRMSRASE